MLTVKESAAEVKIAASAVRDVVQQGNGMTEKQLAQHLQQSMYYTCSSFLPAEMYFCHTNQLRCAL